MCAYLTSRLEVLPKRFPDILEPNIRGKGLIAGLGFKDETIPGKIVRMAREKGVLVLPAGSDAVRFIPGLTIEKGEIDDAMDVITSCLIEC
jgi:acetylornithine aminotransferase